MDPAGLLHASHNTLHHRFRLCQWQSSEISSVLLDSMQLFQSTRKLRCRQVSDNEKSKLLWCYRLVTVYKSIQCRGIWWYNKIRDFGSWHSCTIEACCMNGKKNKWASWAPPNTREFIMMGRWCLQAKWTLNSQHEWHKQHTVKARISSTGFTTWTQSADKIFLNSASITGLWSKF